jgi:predicted transcriptional regulator
MKAVLISIQPKWCELIASGKKTVEVRKTKPKLETPFKCYIYCTNWKDNTYWGNHYKGKLGKVIGEFVCDEIHKFTKAFFDEQEPQDTEEIEFWIDQFLLSYNGLQSYVGKKDFFGWHITDLVIYDKPRELSEFTGLRKTKFGYAPYEIKRPFQSWGYVYEDYT